MTDKSARGKKLQQIFDDIAHIQGDLVLSPELTSDYYNAPYLQLAYAKLEEVRELLRKA